MTPLIPLDSITNVDISIQENHTGTVTICGITKTAAEWRDMASSFSDGAKWTKVTEELPDGDETVIVHGHTGYRGFGWHDGEYWRDCVSGDRFANLKLNIEHWMPLPEAPK